MNSNQKQVQQRFLDTEKEVMKKLESSYDRSLKTITDRISKLQFDIGRLKAEYDWLNDDDPEKEKVRSQIQSKIYQKGFQQALRGQIDDILNKLHTKNYTAVSEYLNGCYEDGYIGTMYDLHGQGIPLIMPIDQKAVVRAVQLDSKLSKPLYTRLGEDIGKLKQNITAELSRGIATGMSYDQVAQQIKFKMTGTYNTKGGAYGRALTIARTEGHRIQVQAGMDACNDAKSKGADVVKQWDSTLDGITRPSHRVVDGEIRELDEAFSNGLMFPGDPSGKAAEVVNCRCALLQRARWELDEDELETLKERAEFFGLDKTENFEDFKKKYLKATNDLTKTSKSDIIPTIDVVDDVPEIIKTMEDREFKTLSLEEFEKIKHSITEEERSIVYGKGHFSGYINSCNARKINNILRNGDQLPRDYQEIVDTLQSIINKNVLPDDIMVTRYVTGVALEAITGVKMPKPSFWESSKVHFAKIDKIPELIAIGTEYTEKGFLSTSGVSDKNVMQNKDVLLNIKAPKGTNCYITTNNRESEIIFGQNTKIKIQAVRIENSGTAKCKVVLDCIIES